MAEGYGVIHVLKEEVLGKRAGERRAARLFAPLDGYTTKRRVESVLGLVRRLVAEDPCYCGPLGALLLEQLEQSVVLLLRP